MSPDTWQTITLAAAVLGPSLLPRLVALITDCPATLSSPRRPKPAALWVLLAVYIVFAAYQLASPPYDVFVSHSHSILVSNDALRVAVIQHIYPRYQKGTQVSPMLTSIADSHPMIELMLNRLTTLENRYMYARWGHVPFIQGVWCRDSNDFALAALPTVLTPYVGAAILIGMMGWTSVAGSDARWRAKRWQSPFGWVIAALATADLTSRWVWDVRAIGGDCVHLSSVLYTIRTLALTLLICAYSFLPITVPSRVMSQRQTITSLNAAVKAGMLASLARGAIARSPVMRRAAMDLASSRFRAENAAFEDITVRRTAQETGLCDEQGHLRQTRENAREWIQKEWHTAIYGPRP